MGNMAILDHTGHTEISWNPASPVEVDIARETFNQFRKKSYLAYRTSDGKHETVHAFDPNDRSLILTPPVVGG